MGKYCFSKIYLLTILFLYVTTTKGQTITTIVGTGTAGFSGDWGPPTAAEINYPGFLSFGGSGYGSLYISDRLNFRVRQLKLGGGIIFTIAGTIDSGFSGDGGHATAAQITIPGGVCVDKHNNVFFADYENQRIRKVNPLGIISTYAGIGIAGFSGDGGPASAAMFNFPNYVVVDTADNLYIADQWNNRIRKIDASGNISTIAGIGTIGFSGDGGPATAAEIAYPNYVRLDLYGNLYITDNGHHRIRKMSPTGIISTIAGNGTQGYSGDGGLATNAQLNFPGGIAIDSHGDVLICDCVNNVIRQIDALTGKISTIAGTGVAGYSGDGGPATAADLYQPVDIAVDNYNNIFFVDWYNNRVREITPIPSLTANIKSDNFSINVYPNPISDWVNIEWDNQEIGSAEIVIVDCLGNYFYNSVITFNSKSGNTKIDCSGLRNGLYWLNVKSATLHTSYCLQIMK